MKKQRKIEKKNIFRWRLIGALLIVVLLCCGCQNAASNREQQKEALLQLADQWAQTFADRDGTGRYDLMTSDLQQQVDRASAADISQWWMPVWVDSKDKEKGMFLRGSSPWVESWDTTLQLEDDATEAQIQIRYDMTDSAEARYVYGETLQCVRQDQTWKVAACTISVELMEQIK